MKFHTSSAKCRTFYPVYNVLTFFRIPIVGIKAVEDTNVAWTAENHIYVWGRYKNKNVDRPTLITDVGFPWDCFAFGWWAETGGYARGGRAIIIIIVIFIVIVIMSLSPASSSSSLSTSSSSCIVVGIIIIIHHHHVIIIIMAERAIQD